MKSLLKALLFILFICATVFLVGKAMADDDPPQEPVKPTCTIDCSVEITSATYYVMSDYFEFNVKWSITGCVEGFESELFFFLDSPSHQMCFPVMSLYPNVPGQFDIPIGFFWGDTGYPAPTAGDVLKALIWVRCNEHKTLKQDEAEKAVEISYE